MRAFLCLFFYTPYNMHSVSSNAVAVALSYTSDEHFTGRYWVNGKKIYTKTIQISIARGNHSFNHNIADIDYITDFRAISKSNNSGEFRTIPFVYYGALDSWSVGIYVTKTAYQIECGTAFASAHSVGYLTLEYTKTV